MKTNQTTTIETRYLRTILEVNAQEAGLIVQRFARLALGEDAEPTGDRFLDYIGAEMAECAARIADYHEKRTQDMAELGRAGGVKSGESRRKRSARSGASGNEAALHENEAALQKSKLNIPNHTEPNHTESNRTESDRGSGDSGSVDISSRDSGSGSDSATSAAATAATATEEADRRAMRGEPPRKGDILLLPRMEVVKATLRLIGEADNKAMHTRLGKAWRRLGDDAFRDVVFTFAAELEAGEIPDNLGAALNARLTKAEGGTA